MYLYIYVNKCYCFLGMCSYSVNKYKMCSKTFIRFSIFIQNISFVRVQLWACLIGLWHWLDITVLSWQLCFCTDLLFPLGKHNLSITSGLRLPEAEMFYTHSASNVSVLQDLHKLEKKTNNNASNLNLETSRFCQKKHTRNWVKKTKWRILWHATELQSTGDQQ